MYSSSGDACRHIEQGEALRVPGAGMLVVAIDTSERFGEQTTAAEEDDEDAERHCNVQSTLTSELKPFLVCMKKGPPPRATNLCQTLKLKNLCGTH